MRNTEEISMIVYEKTEIYSILKEAENKINVLPDSPLKQHIIGVLLAAKKTCYCNREFQNEAWVR